MAIAEADRGDPDEHQLPLEPLGIDGAGQDVGGGDEARGIGRREVDPHGAVGFRGDVEVTDADGLHAAPAGADDQGRRSARHPQHVEPEGGHDGLSDGGGEERCAGPRAPRRWR